MLLLHEVHEVVGARELEFEAAIRDDAGEYRPPTAADARWWALASPDDDPYPYPTGPIEEPPDHEAALELAYWRRRSGPGDCD